MVAHQREVGGEEPARLSGFEPFLAGYDELEAIRNYERACHKGFVGGLEKEPEHGYKPLERHRGAQEERG